MTKIDKSSFEVDGKKFSYFDLNALDKDISSLPFSLKVLLENLLRKYDGENINQNHIDSVISSVKDPKSRIEIAFSPARVLMQDFTGVPAVVDLAAMRDAAVKAGYDPKAINPQVPVDLVIDHSVQVDNFGSADSFKKNVDIEFQRNFERYKFLKWAQQSFDNFRVVPPGTGICHQVNLESLAPVVCQKEIDGELIAYPDTVVGTDSHTTMINGLSVLGWGVGGIEAEAAMLGQPISMLIPEVIGFKLTGKLSEGITATDLVLNITQILREKGVVGKFVEFYGPALESLTLADKATISNMAPEYGATCGIFPPDQKTLDYLNLTARDLNQIKLVERYFKEQKLFVEDYNSYNPTFSDQVELDISTIKPSLAGPKRPQDRVDISSLQDSFFDLCKSLSQDPQKKVNNIANGDIVIAAITSCTNTSNPSVLIAAALVAKKAIEFGLKINDHVKTSFAPGSKAVSEYLENSGLQQYLDKIGFNLVGYGCTTCIGNSGPLRPDIEQEIKDDNLIVGSVLSGNRNFEGRVHPLVKANYLASPPLVVAYALHGNLNIDLSSEPIATTKDGKKIYLKDIWPTKAEIDKITDSFVKREAFVKRSAELFVGDQQWQKIEVKASQTYHWDDNSTYIRLPNFFDNLGQDNVSDFKSARIIALFGDSITTDHISPAGNIAANSSAAKYLEGKGVAIKDFNSYGSRRGNHEVMMRGTFANIRIKNLLLKNDIEGGFSINYDNQVVSIYDAAMSFKSKNTPLIVMAGKEYGTGSSRDWAAKGTMLLGIKAAIAESFERIHRSNLIGMGVLPLQFKKGESYRSLGISGDETIDIVLDGKLSPRQEVKCFITSPNSDKREITLNSRIDTANEVNYFKSGGILQYVLSCL